MSEQVLNQFRSDKALRDDCVAIYTAMGMDLNTAFRMFMERTRMVRGLPFPAVLPDTVPLKPSQAQATLDALREEASGFPEMTLDEIISTIHSHPTVTEAMREAALQAEKRAIHTKN